MVVVGILATNVQLFYNTRFLGVSYRKWLFYQIKTIGAVYAVAAVSRVIVGMIPNGFLLSIGPFGLDHELFVGSVLLCLSGLLYLVIVGGLFVAFPGLAGVRRDELGHLVATISALLRGYVGESGQSADRAGRERPE
jgi:hypothetical protein